MRRRRRHWVWVSAATVVLVAAALGVPYVSAGRFGDHIRTSLQTSLGRSVETGPAHFRLFPAPGFTVERVVIHDDPSAGLEPLAYVPSMRAEIRLRSLWLGRLEFASLRLGEPSINLVKTQAGHWNVQDLLARAAGSDLPEISITGARINFKFADIKSVYYFSDSEIEVSPPDAGGRFRLRFEGTPSRTDRPSHGFGRIRAEGTWRRGSSPGPLQITLRVGRSELAEISTLVYGYDSGLHGQVAAELEARGSLLSLEFHGTAKLEEIHWWEAMPPYAEGFAAKVGGRLDLAAGRLEIEATDVAGTSVSVQFRVSDYLSHPRWGVLVTCKGLELAPLLAMARRAGAKLAAVDVDGRLLGAVGYSDPAGWAGRLQLEEGRLAAPGGLVLGAPRLELVLNDGHLQILPSALVAENGEKVTVQGAIRLSDLQTDLKLTASGLSLARSLAEGSPLSSLGGLPLFSRIRAGSWSGTLHLRWKPGVPPAWAGTIELTRGRVLLPALAVPVVALQGRVVLDGDSVRLERASARLGNLELEGAYGYQPRSKRPHRLRLRVPEISGAELEHLFGPALPRPRGLLARTLGLRREDRLPWMHDWHATAEIEAGSFTVAGVEFRNVRARVFWDEDRVEVTWVTAQVERGRFEGYARATLSSPGPAYQVGGQFHGVRWRGGVLEGDGLLRTSGVGPQLLVNLSVSGSFSAHGIELAPEASFRTVSGCYEMLWRSSKPHLRLTCLRLWSEPEAWLGHGETDRDGRLLLAFARGREQLRMSGTLAPLRLEVVTSKPRPPEAVVR
jgi:hypothetical protein